MISRTSDPSQLTVPPPNQAIGAAVVPILNVDSQEAELPTRRWMLACARPPREWLQPLEPIDEHDSSLRGCAGTGALSTEDFGVAQLWGWGGVEGAFLRRTWARAGWGQAQGRGF